MDRLNNIQTKVSNYPILKHFSEGEIMLNPQTQMNTLGKTIFGVTTVGVVGASGYLLWTYVLPPIMIMLGQFIGLALTAVGVVGLFIMFPLIIKAIKRFSEASERALIRQDPFGELQDQKRKMILDRNKFKDSKVKIKSLKSTAEIESSNSEKNCKDFQSQIVSLSNESKKIKEIMDKMISTDGLGVKESDDYSDLENKLAIKLSTAQRLSHQLEQSKLYVQKYGSRANIMAKLDRNLTRAETAINIKIDDFDATVDMLQKDFEFASSAKNVTDAAKSVLSVSDSWELAYATNVITSTISMDMARSNENMIDLDVLTSKYSIDSDELYNNLDILATKISGGTDIVPSANRYSSPNYKLTQDDKQSSGGFGNIF